MWRPSPAQIEQANVTRLMRAHGIGGIDELRRRSVDEPAWFWDAVVADLDIRFSTPYTDVFDASRGIAWTTWFVGGRVNLATACVGRWRDDPARADAPAIIAETEDGEIRRLTYRELADDVDRLANALRGDGVGPGDVVGVYLPMLPEAVVAAYAIALIGAIYLPIFSGFAAGAVASRLKDAEACMVITSDGGLRRGRATAMKPVLDL
jgi:acetyl-CoA synthetase